MSENQRNLGKIPVPENIEDDEFPIGMQVLAIDANIVCLRYLVILLHKCRYKVRATTEAAEALRLIRENKEKFDIVITDVVRQDMDGFKLLEIIGLEMDVPVIMISANNDRDNIMKGIKHGARDYLLKPVRLQEMKNIWQHVLRKHINNNPSKYIIKKEITDEKPILQRNREKNITMEENETKTPSDHGISSTRKKPRVIWSPELHLKFLSAVQQLGEEGAVPNTILKIMNEPGLTRENVASHLQKYRNMLKKQSAAPSQQSKGVVDTNGNWGIFSINERSHGELNYGDDHLLSKSNPPSRYLTDMQKPQMIMPNCQPSNIFQENVQYSHFVGQVQKPLGTYLPLPEFKGLKFPAQDHLRSMPYYQYPAAPISCFTPTCQFPAQQGYNVSWPFSNLSTSGEQEGGSSLYLSGSGDLSVRGQVISFNNQNVQAPTYWGGLNDKDDSKSVQHFDQSGGSIFHRSNSFGEDDLSMMVKQFSEEGAPEL